MTASQRLVAVWVLLVFALCACSEEPGNLVTMPRANSQAPIRRDLPRYVDANGIEFVLIPAGSFVMGLDTAAGGFPDEGPAHACHILKPFYLSRYEVSQAQWEVVMGSNPSYFKKGALPDPPSALNYKAMKAFDGGSNPVENVSWDEVQEFIERLNAREGKKVYQLPTEAQWEYAARAGGAVLEESGQQPHWTAIIVWFYDGTRSMTMPVGSFQANAWGLYDVDGNVREWCQDTYSPDAYVASVRTEQHGPRAGDLKVNRGGCWSDPMNLRLVERFFNHRTQRSPFIGFRLVREAN